MRATQCIFLALCYASAASAGASTLATPARELFVNCATGGGSVCSSAQPCRALRQAVELLQRHEQATIWVNSPSTVCADNRPLDIENLALTIVGRDGAPSILRFNSTRTGFEVDNSTLVVSNLVFERASIAIELQRSVLRAQRVEFRENRGAVSSDLQAATDLESCVFKR